MIAYVGDRETRHVSRGNTYKSFPGLSWSSGDSPQVSIVSGRIYANGAGDKMARATIDVLLPPSLNALPPKPIENTSGNE